MSLKEGVRGDEGKGGTDQENRLEQHRAHSRCSIVFE